MTASPPAPRLVIGIDLGTTNSLAAIRAGRGARVLRDKDGEPLIPSIVCFHPDGRTIVGREAKALRLSFPERTVFSAKRLIGRAGAEVDREARLLPYRVHRGERDLARIAVADHDYAPEQIAAMSNEERAAAVWNTIAEYETLERLGYTEDEIDAMTPKERTSER